MSKASGVFFYLESPLLSLQFNVPLKHPRRYKLRPIVMICVKKTWVELAVREAEEVWS